MKITNPVKSVPKKAWLYLLAFGIGYLIYRIFIGIKMRSNQSNESDGSFHIRVEPKKKKSKPLPTVEIKKEVKNDKTKNRK